MGKSLTRFQVVIRSRSMCGSIKSCADPTVQLFSLRFLYFCSPEARLFTYHRGVVIWKLPACNFTAMFCSNWETGLSIYQNDSSFASLVYLSVLLASTLVIFPTWSRIYSNYGVHTASEHG